MSNLRKAIHLAGGITILARKIGLHKTAIYHWGECPAERVLAVAEATEWKVTPHELRPDLYPNEQDAMPHGCQH